MEQRRTKRFELNLPVELLRAGAEHLSQFGKTRNISSGGILFVSSTQLEIGGPVEYVITLSSGNGGNVSLRCLGKVLRQHGVSEFPDGNQYSFAVTLERYEFMRSLKHVS